MTDASRPARRPKLDLNSASAEALAQVPGLNPDLARLIVSLRPFKHTKELLRVPGLDFEAFEQAAAHVKVARPPSAAPRPRRRAPAGEAEPAAPPVTPVQVHVHVNAAAPAETTTYRTLPAAPTAGRLDEVVEPVIIAEPARRPAPERGLAPSASRALVPLGRQMSTALFESYAGPRVVFALFSFTLLAVALAMATGRLSWRAEAAPPAATEVRATETAPASAPSQDQLATQVGQAVAATLAAQPAPSTTPAATAPPPPSPTPTVGFVSNSGLAGVGPQVFNETFIPAGYWSVGETDFSRIAIEEGWLRVVIKTPGSIA
ncbi:MAG: helix-hairpin-helix domain-containing protein, partial [Anaerolineales bacterium]|nr:helix-hairpin-helix domain-containing protein [Anaerolineales bacterium]